MLNTRDWYVWLWLGADGKPIFLGIGRRQGALHPADALWERRFRDDSSVAHWLREQREQPPRGIVGDVGTGMAEDMARSLFTINRKTLLADGHKLLSARPISSFVPGGGRAKAVIWNDELYFPSVRSAARYFGLSHAVIIDRLKIGRDGFRYA